MFVGVVMKNPREAVTRYGVRVWNGDKLTGKLVELKDSSVIIVGEAVGGSNEYPENKTVEIDLEDVKMVYHRKLNTRNRTVILYEG